MRKTIMIGIMLSFLLLLVTPCINAIQLHEVQEEMENNIQNRLDLFQTKLNNFTDNDLIKPSILNILLIVYIIGYFAFLPFAWFLTLANNPYGNPSFLELLISTILGSFGWPIIVLAIIRAYIEGLHTSQRI